MADAQQILMDGTLDAGEREQGERMPLAHAMAVILTMSVGVWGAIVLALHLVIA